MTKTTQMSDEKKLALAALGVVETVLLAWAIGGPHPAALDQVRGGRKWPWAALLPIQPIGPATYSVGRKR